MVLRQSSTTPRYVDQLSEIYPFLLLAMLPTGVLFAFALGTPALARRGLLLIGPPVFGAFAVLYRSYDRSPSVESLLVGTRASTWQALFLVTFSASIATLALTSYRPWYYFGLVAVMYAAVLLQILTGARPSAIVGQLCLLVLTWAYGLTLNYGLFFGGTSTLMHTFYADLTYASGTLVPASLTEYALFPLYHTFVAGTAHLLGVPVSFVIAAIVPVPFVVTVAFVYKLVGGITGNEQLGLLTALVFSLHPTVLYYAPYMITRTMAFVGFLAMLYVGYSRYRLSTVQYWALLAPLVAFVALVHHVSTPQILSLLFLLAAIEWLLTDERFVAAPALGLAAFAGAYWGTIGSQFARQIARTFMEPGEYASADVVGTATESSHHIGYFLHNYALIFLALVGIGVVLLQYRDRYEVVFGVFALATLVLAVPSPIHAIGETVHMLRMDRYVLLLSPFVAFAVAMGLYGLYQGARARSSSVGRALGVGLIVVLVTLLAATSATAASTAPNAADSEDLEWTGPPVHFTDEELRGLEFVRSDAPTGSSVAGDWQTSRYYRPNAYEFEGAEEHGVPIYDRETIQTVNDVHDYEGLLVIRTERLESGGLLLAGDGKGEREAFGDGAAMETALADADVVYQNEAVTIYRTGS